MRTCHIEASWPGATNLSTMWGPCRVYSPSWERKYQNTVPTLTCSRNCVASAMIIGAPAARGRQPPCSLPPQRRRLSFGLGRSPTTLRRGGRFRHRVRLLGIRRLRRKDRRCWHGLGSIGSHPFLNRLGRTLAGSQDDRALDQLSPDLIAGMEPELLSEVGRQGKPTVEVELEPGHVGYSLGRERPFSLGQACQALGGQPDVAPALTDLLGQAASRKQHFDEVPGLRLL